MKKLPSFQSIIEKTAIQSWSWYHFIFLYAIIPIILLIIPLLDFNHVFILDICHPTFLSIYMSNFEHTTLPHLSGNLIMYLLSITGIFFLEKDKLRFCNMLAFLFIILPIIGSMLYIGFLGKICLVREFSNTFGFSAITLGFTGYFIYLLLLSSIPQFFKIIDEECNKNHKTTLNHVVSNEVILALILVSNVVILFIVDLFGILSGMFSLANSVTLNNGFLHSIGFVTGIFLPMIMQLKKENKLDNFHRTLVIHFEGLIIFLTIYLVFWYLYV